MDNYATHKTTQQIRNWFPAAKQKNSGTAPAASRFFEVTRGISMLNAFIRPRSAVTAVSAVAAATAQESYSSDTILVERIAAGDRLAMQALFARHRTPFTVDFFGLSATFRSRKTTERGILDAWRQADRFEDRSSVWLG
jgi:hypothetical protein